MQANVFYLLLALIKLITSTIRDTTIADSAITKGGHRLDPFRTAFVDLVAYSICLSSGCFASSFDLHHHDLLLVHCLQFSLVLCECIVSGWFCSVDYDEQSMCIKLLGYACTELPKRQTTQCTPPKLFAHQALSPKQKRLMCKHVRTLLSSVLTDMSIFSSWINRQIGFMWG